MDDDTRGDRLSLAQPLDRVTDALLTSAAKLHSAARMIEESVGLEYRDRDYWAVAAMDLAEVAASEIKQALVQ